MTAGAGPAMGLTPAEAARRLAEFGPNEIQRERPPSRAALLARQFNSPVIWLLAGACVLSIALREVADAAAILAIVLLNGFIGFSQERRAERAIDALRSMTAPRARVRRDGRAIVIPAAEVVPGDLLLLEAGDVVPADARLLDANALATIEAALTGESAPVEKSSRAVAPDAPLADRSDYVFSGTAIANGTGSAEVAATGGATELGKIAHLLTTAQQAATPLQQHLADVSGVLLRLCLGIVAVVAVTGLLRGRSPLDVLLAAVSLAVAAVPEGLPAIVTIALALGVQRMAARHVLIRRLPAVETLGCATVICTDKTGTLTTGSMAVREVWGPDRNRVLFTAASCSDAELDRNGGKATGDPTEVAILAAAADLGIDRDSIEQRYPRTHVEPFDTTRKWMSITRADGARYVKGALEAVLPLCAAPLSGALLANADMAARGLRVIAVAAGPAARQGLELLGLIGIADPPRPEAIAAVAAAREAGIHVAMITGDHPLTAAAIARELGLLDQDAQERDIVHARATPEDKLAIVRSWKTRGAVVAMTGDGANDAPALREAHIGIAMGLTGTEVTREASDMILADDNFASIIAAVREGRGIYDNIRKALVYLLAGNTAELSVMLAAALAGLPLPLLAVQLLWINIVTDGLPAIALVMDPTSDDVLRRPPRPPDEPMLGRTEWRYVSIVGLLDACVTLGVFTWSLQAASVAEARSAAFSTLVLTELFRAFGARSTTRIFWQLGAFTNLRLLFVVSMSVLVQIAIHHFEVTQAFFGIAPLSPGQWGVSFGAALCPITLIEVAKLVRPAAGSQSRC
jgi:P-type Ca2+ transporter type 2C